MKPTLFVLAAGMGSRYGGLKQLDGLGPNGETIMDYSVFDAMRAGFGKIVFVIRKDFEQDFKDKVLAKYENHIPVELVFQDLNSLPEGCICPEDRVKPWGTNHAVMMGKDVIKEPFAVINADDFYGRDSFVVLSKALQAVEGKTNDYCMIAFFVGKTLSDSGSVSRGVCASNEEGYLTDVVERTDIARVDGQVYFKDEKNENIAISDDTLVSMNMWGFTPDYFAYSDEGFKKFFNENKENPKAEYYIPTLVNDLIKAKQAKCRVHSTTSQWFGVTYAADRQGVVDRLQSLVNQGEYPSPLFL